jgi:hypothetical protein
MQGIYAAIMSVHFSRLEATPTFIQLLQVDNAGNRLGGGTVVRISRQSL